MSLTPAPEEGFYIDGVPVKVTATRDPNSCSTVLNLTLTIPDVSDARMDPHQAHLVAQLVEAAAGHRHRVRLQLLLDAAVKSEFERLQPDGSIRPLASIEGTW